MEVKQLLRVTMPKEVADGILNDELKMHKPSLYIIAGCNGA
jgi:hypothetical protein